MNEKLYKYGVIYFGTTLMMISPFVIDSWVGKVGMMLGLILITVQTQKTKQYKKTLIGINIDKFYQESAIVMNSKQTTSQSAVLSVLPIDVWIIIFQKLGIIGTQTFMNAVTT